MYISFCDLNLDAARRFFQTKVEEDSLKRKGKYSDKVKRQRKRNRINRVSICMSCVLPLPLGCQTVMHYVQLWS